MKDMAQVAEQEAQRARFLEERIQQLYQGVIKDAQDKDGVAKLFNEIMNTEPTEQNQSSFE